MPANLENSAVATGQGQVSFHSNPKEGKKKKKKGNAKDCSSYHTIMLISHSSKGIFIIFQASRWTESFQMYKVGLEKVEELKSKLPTFTGS